MYTAEGRGYLGAIRIQWKEGGTVVPYVYSRSKLTVVLLIDILDHACYIHTEQQLSCCTVLYA
jgi:hypothetical protein